MNRTVWQTMKNYIHMHFISYSYNSALKRPIGPVSFIKELIKCSKCNLVYGVSVCMGQYTTSLTELLSSVHMDEPNHTLRGISHISTLHLVYLWVSYVEYLKDAIIKIICVRCFAGVSL